jgi:hypothetical protein
LLYDDDGSPKFVDRTSEAASPDIVADVYHPTSSALLADDGDMLYLGMDNPFYLFHVVLSTLGESGVVSYFYWNGNEWEEFTPFNDEYHFEASPGNVLLWNDSNSIPGNWQKTVIDGTFKFWIKIEVISSFTTPPIGSQITAIPDTKFLNIIANI